MPTDYVCLTDLKVVHDDLLPGDRIDIDGLIERGVFNEALVAHLTKQRQIAVCTRETYQYGLTRRPADSPWPPQGFTPAFLIEKGWMDAEQEPAPKERPKAAPGQPVAKAAERVDHVTLTEDKILVGIYFVQPRKVGNFTQYDVCDGEGKLLRAKSFRHKAQAVAFLEDIYTSPDSTDNSAEKQEGEGDDRDVQPGAADGEGSDPATDR